VSVDGQAIERLQSRYAGCRVRAEAAKLESTSREARTRWDEGRVGGWR
jgi:hypothetical protein